VGGRGLPAENDGFSKVFLRLYQVSTFSMSFQFSPAHLHKPLTQAVYFTPNKKVVVFRLLATFSLLKSLISVGQSSENRVF
jgi:hypothetical protein